MSSIAAQAVPVRPSLTMTEDEFVRWADEDTHAEWVDGEVQLKMPIHINHDDIQFWLRAQVQLFVTRRRLGKVVGPQFTTRLPQKPSRRDPDLMFISAERLHLLRDTYLDGPADLVVEIVSPDSLSRDYREKFLEYEAGGVREYWIVNPLSQTVEAYRRDEKTNAFVLIAPGGDDGRIASTVLVGWWLRPADCFAEPRRDPVELLAEIGGA